MTSCEYGHRCVIIFANVVYIPVGLMNCLYPHLRLIYIGKVNIQKCQRYYNAVSPSLLALATLDSSTQIGSFLFHSPWAKASKEGDIPSRYC
jgi:hypothetical protein